MCTEARTDSSCTRDCCVASAAVHTAYNRTPAPLTLGFSPWPTIAWHRKHAAAAQLQRPNNAQRGPPWGGSATIPAALLPFCGSASSSCAPFGCCSAAAAPGCCAAGSAAPCCDSGRGTAGTPSLLSSCAALACVIALRASAACCGTVVLGWLASAPALPSMHLLLAALPCAPAAAIHSGAAGGGCKRRLEKRAAGAAPPCQVAI